MKAQKNKKNLTAVKMKHRPTLQISIVQIEDSFSNIFMHQIINWPIKDIQKQSFEHVWSSKPKQKFLHTTHACNDCWIICTAKRAITQVKLRVAGDVAPLTTLGTSLLSIQNI